MGWGGVEKVELGGARKWLLERALVQGDVDPPKKKQFAPKSLERRMQWGRAVAGIEAVGALPDGPSNSVNV